MRKLLFISLVTQPIFAIMPYWGHIWSNHHTPSITTEIDAVPDTVSDIVTDTVRTRMALPTVHGKKSPRIFTVSDHRAIFRAICLWEGRGRIRLDAVNKSENAHGPAQIRPGYLQDANERLGTSYTLQDCHDYEISYRLACAYWQRYRATTDEQRARMHNGGPDGHLQDCTLGYWRGVLSYL